MEHKRGHSKQRVGVVVSDKMNKTRVVRIDSLTRHAFYSKTVKKFENFKVHDEKNESKEGDRVRIIETRPLSKDKRWRILKIIKSVKE